MTTALTKDEARDIAREAVRETLVSLGVDVADPIKAQRNMAALRELADMTDDAEFQRDMVHLRKWRKNMEAVESRGVVAAVGFVLVGGIALVLYAFKVKLLGL